MKVIPPTYHQMINYLTNVGQVDLLSNKMAARQCYQLSIQEQRREKNSENPPLEVQTLAWKSQFVAQIRAEEKDPLVVDPWKK